MARLKPTRAESHPRVLGFLPQTRVSPATGGSERDRTRGSVPRAAPTPCPGRRIPRRALQSSTRGALCTFVLTLLPLLRQPATPTRTIAATPMQTLPQSQPTPKRIDTPSLEEPSDLEELEQFAKTFKQRRIKLGFTQVGRTRPSLGCPSSPGPAVGASRPRIRMFLSAVVFQFYTGAFS